MKEINIAKVIQKKRKERHLTQDDIAAYIGVSKASVSKWETAQSYPDITFLPQLAALFNISIDELLGYEPQLTKTQIRTLYCQLSERFATDPFEEVLGQCREIIKEYYSCFPLLCRWGSCWSITVCWRRAAESRRRYWRKPGRFCQDQGGERGDRADQTGREYGGGMPAVAGKA